MPLTARQIETARPRDKDYKLTDAQGLYLLVKKSGAKYWNLKYRFVGKEKKLSIGVYPTVTLAEARSRREDARRLLREGKDPSYEKQASKQAHRVNVGNTFKAIATEWFAHKARQWTERYLNDQIARMENKVYPFIGQRPITEIQPMEILNCLREVEKDGKLETLRKTRQICTQIFTHAIITGRAATNPAAHLSSALLPPEQAEGRCLSTEQLPAFLQDLNKSPRLMALATQLLMLTALRTGEMRLGRWDEINFDKFIWEIPKERMKKRRPHLVPLSTQAVAILQQVKTLTASLNSPYIFPGVHNPANPRARRCINDFLMQIGWHDHTAAHGLRHTFSTLTHDAGFDSAWIELQLAHVDKNAIRGVYNHAQYLDGRREMMQWYADHVDNLSRGIENKAI
ncbi:tyrosine-type recombinase/integrase [Enterobacter asburiae]|uniref:tyrosine-type recombinase/integrase n=3 Tax=Enterobacter asburiae TaxID=61645 RepID=UPI003F56DC6A